MLNEWKSAIAAADLADWVTVGAYLIAVLACTQASRFAWLTRRERDRSFWRLTTVLLIFLGINEILDLQALLTVLGREHARANGWYGQHRPVQYIFILALALLGVLAGIVTLFLTRKAHTFGASSPHRARFHRAVCYRAGRILSSPRRAARSQGTVV